MKKQSRDAISAGRKIAEIAEIVDSYRPPHEILLDPSIDPSIVDHARDGAGTPLALRYNNAYESTHGLLPDVLRYTIQ